MLGRVLKVPKSTVDSILKQYSNPKDQLFHVIDEFVKQVDPPPTWRVIANAVRDPLIGMSSLAQKIEQNHCLMCAERHGKQWFSLCTTLHKLPFFLSQSPERTTAVQSSHDTTYLPGSGSAGSLSHSLSRGSHHCYYSWAKFCTTHTPSTRTCSVIAS